jgi:hypothetical protein
LISFHYSTCLSSIFSISFHYFLPYCPYLIPIQLTFIWKIWKKGKLNSEKIWTIWKKIVKWYGKYGIKESWIVKRYKKYGRKEDW